MSGPEFFDPFGHGNMETDDRPKSADGKVFSLRGHTITHDEADKPLDFKSEIGAYVDEIMEQGQPTRAIIIMDGPDLGINIRYVGEMDLAELIGTLQVAGFVVMHETLDES